MLLDVFGVGLMWRGGGEELAKAEAKAIVVRAMTPRA